MPMFTFSVPVTVPADRKQMRIRRAAFVCYHSPPQMLQHLERDLDFSALLVPAQYNVTASKPLADTQRTGRQQVLPDPMVEHALDYSQQQGQGNTAMISEQLAGC